MLLVHWVLIVLLAFDLAGSPFHAHAHDLGAAGFGVEAHQGVDADIPHLEAQDGDGFGHSLGMLRPESPQPPGWEATAEDDSLRLLWLAAAVLVALDAPRHWRAVPAHERPAHGRHLRPDGRAPPNLLHA